MTHPTSIDISNMPELVRIAEVVEATKTPRELKRESKTVAMIIPATNARPKKKREKTKADYEAFKAAAGSWKDIDAEQLVADIYRWRQEGSRPAERPS